MNKFTKHIESFIHELLKQFRTETEKEWFYIDYDRAKNILDETKKYVDKLVKEINKPINEMINKDKNLFFHCDKCN